MKKLLSLVLTCFLAIHLVGCSGGSGGIGSTSSATTLSSLTDSDLAAVEAGLVASRILAAEAAPTINAALLADETAEEEALPEFRFHGRRFRGGRSGTDWRMLGATGTCPIEMERPAGGPMRMRIGPQACEVVQNEDGGYTITWPDGHEVMISKPADGSTTGEITINGVSWTFTFGETGLLSLQQAETGRTLQITESDTGVLQITPNHEAPRWARWNESGEIEGEFAAEQRRYRFRGGRFE